MARKDDTDKLLARESRRRASLVGSIAGVEAPEAAPETKPEAKPEERAPVAVSEPAAPAVLETPDVPVVTATVAPPQSEPHTDVPVIRSVVRPVKRESRTVRRQVVLTPSLNKAIDRKLRADGLSFNEVVHQLLQNWVEAE